MLRTALRTTAAACCFGIVFAAATRGQEAAPKATVWDKVYTEEQAGRGEALYQRACSACHADDLGGSGYAPALKGDDFAFQWGTKSVGEFIERTRTLMPPDNPGSLPATTYRDITAFILKANKYPAGDTALPDDTDALKKIVITAQP